MRDSSSDTIVGSTRYHDVVPAVDRVEIGYTFYAASCQRSHVDTACKLLLFARRRDGAVRDTVMFSTLAAEWPDVRRHLETRLARHG